MRGGREARPQPRGVYVRELVLRGLDSTGRVREYVEAAHDLLDKAQEELGKGGAWRAYAAQIIHDGVSF